ncbi:DUF192 domain-containing protein [Candidatus Woesearchaeota archaeon]|nr:DUF192 domain-containing protein [Candidatus Woesearchaeota archaeon]
MNKILVSFLLIFLIGCSKSFNEILIDNGKELIKVKVEIADGNDERRHGLMLRTKLDENSGMLFVFDEENYQTFWMKNTLIPLDMIFISKNMEIVDIKSAVPCKEDPCTLHKSARPAKYVLEVNGNFTSRNSVIVGNKAEIKKLYK